MRHTEKERERAVGQWRGVHVLAGSWGQAAKEREVVARACVPSALSRRARKTGSSVLLAEWTRRVRARPAVKRSSSRPADLARLR